MPSLFVVSSDVTWAKDDWQSSACNIHEKSDDLRVGSPNECTDAKLSQFFWLYQALCRTNAWKSDHYTACVSTRQKSLGAPRSMQSKTIKRIRSMLRGSISEMLKVASTS